MPGERHQLGGTELHNKARGPLTATNSDLKPPLAEAPRSPGHPEGRRWAASSRSSPIREGQDSRGGSQSSSRTPESGRVQRTVTNCPDKLTPAQSKSYSGRKILAFTTSENVVHNLRRLFLLLLAKHFLQWSLLKYYFKDSILWV